MPTKTAAAGKFESRGDDFIQFVDSSGAVKHHVDSDGVMYGKDCVVSGTRFSDLKDQVDHLQFSGLPSTIDSGTF